MACGVFEGLVTWRRLLNPQIRVVLFDRECASEHKLQVVLLGILKIVHFGATLLLLFLNYLRIPRLSSDFIIHLGHLEIIIVLFIQA